MNLDVNWGRREEEEQEAKESRLPESVHRASFSLLTEKETGFQRKQDNMRANSGRKIKTNKTAELSVLLSYHGLCNFAHFVKNPEMATKCGVCFRVTNNSRMIFFDSGTIP